MQTPAVGRAAMAGVVEIAFEAFEDVENLRKARLVRSFGGKRRAVAAAAQQQHDRILAPLRFELAHEARIARQARARRPRHVQILGHVADECTLLGRAHVDEQRVAGLDERPGILRRHAARVR